MKLPLKPPLIRQRYVQPPQDSTRASRPGGKYSVGRFGAPRASRRMHFSYLDGGIGVAFCSFLEDLVMLHSAEDFWASPKHSPLHKRWKFRMREVRETSQAADIEC